MRPRSRWVGGTMTTSRSRWTGNQAWPGACSIVSPSSTAPRSRSRRISWAGSWLSTTLTPGACAWKARSSRGTSVVAIESRNASRTRPVSGSSRLASVARSRSWRPTSSRAASTTTSPSGVSTTPVGTRSKIRTPELVLEPSEGPRERGLAGVQCSRRVRDVAELGEGSPASRGRAAARSPIIRERMERCRAVTLDACGRGGGPSTGDHAAAAVPPGRRHLRPRALPRGHRRLPARDGRDVRRGDVDLRPALRHPGAAARARRDVRRLGDARHPRPVPDHRRPGRHPARRRPAVGGGRSHPADPPRPVVGRGRRPRDRRRSLVARAAGAAGAAGGDPRRTAGRRDGVPPRGAAPVGPGTRVRPLHRRHGARRDGRPAGDRADRRRDELALGPRRSRRRRARRRLAGGVAAAGLARLRATRSRRRRRPPRCPGGRRRPRAGRPLRPRLLRGRRPRRRAERPRLPAQRSAVRPLGGDHQPRLPGVRTGLGQLDGRPAASPTASAGGRPSPSAARSRSAGCCSPWTVRCRSWSWASRR